MIIFPADRIVEAQESGKLSATMEVRSADFQAIMHRARRAVNESQQHIREGIKAARNLDFYETEGHFVNVYVLQVDGQRIRGERIFLVSGARPLIPPIKGIEDIDYLTNDNVFDLRDRPESIVIIGGGT
jgi:mycothione reductase